MTNVHTSGEDEQSLGQASSDELSSEEGQLPTTDAGGPAPSEFYERLQRDDSEVAENVVSMMDELSFTIEPGFRPFLGSFLQGFAVTPLVLFIPLFILTMLVLGILALWPRAAPIRGALIAAFLTVGVTIPIQINRYLSAKHARYEFDHGVLRVRKGGFNTQVNVYEIYRVEEISAAQDWASRRANLAHRYVTVHRTGGGQKTIELKGLGTLNEVEQYASRLRERVVAMRTMTSLKWFVS